MTNIDNLKEKFYNIIMDLVVNDEQSPYNQILRKTLDISTISHATARLSPTSLTLN